MPRVLGRSQGDGRFFMGEVLLQGSSLEREPGGREWTTCDVCLVVGVDCQVSSTLYTPHQESGRGEWRRGGRDYRGTSLIKNSADLEDPTVGLCSGPYGGPREVGCLL